MPLIELTDIGLNIGTRTIIKNISFSLKKNDFITIVGPNGAGKTSLLKILLGIQNYTAGSLYKAANLKIGYLAQNTEFSSYLPITAYDFLHLHCKQQEFIDRAVHKTQVEDLLDMQLALMSKGQKQKVLLTSAIINDPDVLILDEPTQNLDLANQKLFYNLLDVIYTKTNTSVIMVSHDLNLVMKDTKTVLCIAQHICCQGQPYEITQDPKFSQIFGDELAKSFAWYQHADTQKCHHQHEN
jgi:zinc transport system ATP-binding protein